MSTRRIVGLVLACIGVTLWIIYGAFLINDTSGFGYSIYNFEPPLTDHEIMLLTIGTIGQGLTILGAIMFLIRGKKNRKPHDNANDKHYCSQCGNLIKGKCIYCEKCGTKLIN